MAIASDRFAHFVAIDWSGAVGAVQPGIAVAVADAGGGAPRLVGADRPWSRQRVLDWLRDDLPADTIVGLDLGPALPFADRGAYFPGWSRSPGDARGLWALVDDLCADDPHLAANTLVDHTEAARHFRRHGARVGDLFGSGAGRLRETERAQRALGFRPSSGFNLVGAAQVGKASLTGMRVLHRLARRLPIWPFDPLPARGSVIVEIYTTIAAVAGGRMPGRAKIRDIAALDAALATLGSAPMGGKGAIDDHRSDALVTAAWLRSVASDQRLWRPAGLASEVARTEGWTFGVP